MAALCSTRQNGQVSKVGFDPIHPWPRAMGGGLGNPLPASMFGSRCYARAMQLAGALKRRLAPAAGGCAQKNGAGACGRRLRRSRHGRD